jgi:hypothetical protein
MLYTVSADALQGFRLVLDTPAQDDPAFPQGGDPLDDRTLERPYRQRLVWCASSEIECV